MNEYTVILLPPGGDTEENYRADVRCETPREAVENARDEAFRMRNDVLDKSDYEIVLVTNGWIDEVPRWRYA
jgi:hypothetical protein